jgi:hypothetical protein
VPLLRTCTSRPPRVRAGITAEVQESGPSGMSPGLTIPSVPESGIAARCLLPPVDRRRPHRQCVRLLRRRDHEGDAVTAHTVARIRARLICGEGRSRLPQMLDAAHYIDEPTSRCAVVVMLGGSRAPHEHRAPSAERRARPGRQRRHTRSATAVGGSRRGRRDLPAGVHPQWVHPNPLAAWTLPPSWH